MAAIPAFVIEYFLLGRTRPDALERYTQDGGIVSDVWIAFGEDRAKPQRVLIAPRRGMSAVKLGYALHRAIKEYRSSLTIEKKRETSAISPLESFVAATLYFDELVRIVLPLTMWWWGKKLDALQAKAAFSGEKLEEMLWRSITYKLGRDVNEVELRRQARQEDKFMERRIIEAAQLAALIGVFSAADDVPSFLKGIEKLDPGRARDRKLFSEWIRGSAEVIASEARSELLRQFKPDYVISLERGFQSQEAPPYLIQRVFLDREASLADLNAIRTIKADAANRVFNVSCKDISWGIIDSGIDSTHPAFTDHGVRDTSPLPVVGRSRVRATYDFSHIGLIRNFDLILEDKGTPERADRISGVVEQLKLVPGRHVTSDWMDVARANLELIADQLERSLQPNWNLIEPLISLGKEDDLSQVVSDHGTHVAGILGGDWRSKEIGPEGQPDILPKGVCPDINLYDFRVICPGQIQSTEFAVLAALEFVQFLNSRGASNEPIIHGVNISLSIPHDVRNYACGATPVCLACDRLSNSGIVVVAAAGNRGWNEQEMGFGNFVYCSITDPGNADTVITVGSTHTLKPHLYGVSYFSSRGPTGDGRIKPDLVAPGEQIRGPVRGEADDEFDGTSMAAPFVSGAAAMLLAQHRELIGTPAKVKSILCESAIDLGRERYFQGHGLVDVLRALQTL
jgi:serine protease AprX